MQTCAANSKKDSRMQDVEAMLNIFILEVVLLMRDCNRYPRNRNTMDFRRTHSHMMLPLEFTLLQII